MLELFGSEYVIDHVMAEYHNRAKEVIYRNYVCDVLKCIAESWGSQVAYEYRELVEPTAESAESGDEVALRVIKRLGLGVKTNGFNESESDIVA